MFDCLEWSSAGAADRLAGVEFRGVGADKGMASDEADQCREDGAIAAF